MAQVVAAVAAAPWVALDTEANSMFVYRERICLIQVNANGRLFLIDPLAIDPAAPDPATLAPLKPLLEDPARTVFLHGGEYDVGSLKRDYGIDLAGVFDTQQAASLLGWEKTGYGAAVEALCGVTLAKDHAQYDWGTRPLDPLAVQYALDDVIHLPQVAERLKDMVAAADLTEEVAIANRAVMDITWSGGFEPAGFWKLKGIRDVPVQALGILFALYQWRDTIARTANKPAGRMLNTELMFAVARQAPTNFQLLKRLGIKGWFMSEHGEAMMEVIRIARAQPPELPPRPISREVPPDEEPRERRLKDWRRAEAENRTRSEGRTVPLQVVLPARSLEYLKRYGAVDLAVVPQLGAKRIARYGDKLRQLCG
jgi:ribonuclease D